MCSQKYRIRFYNVKTIDLKDQSLLHKKLEDSEANFQLLFFSV